MKGRRGAEPGMTITVGAVAALWRLIVEELAQVLRSQRPWRAGQSSVDFTVAPGPDARVRLVNLTPHDVTLYVDGRPRFTWPRPAANAKVPRAAVKTHAAYRVMDGELGVRLERLEYTGEVHDLPDPSPGTVYIVSQITAKASGRVDLVFPLEHREDGRVVGCTGFGSFAPWIAGEHDNARRVLC